MGGGSRGAELHGLWERLHRHCQEGESSFNKKKNQLFLFLIVILKRLPFSSTTAATVGTFSVPSVRPGTRSRRPPRSRSACARRVLRNSRADFLSFHRYHPRDAPWPFPVIFTCTKKDKPSAEACQRDSLRSPWQGGVVLCVSVPLLLLWTAKRRRQWFTNIAHLFLSFCSIVASRVWKHATMTRMICMWLGECVSCMGAESLLLSTSSHTLPKHMSPFDKYN